jgi:sulfate adenylyltransferase
MSQHIYAHEHPESETDRGGGFTLWFTGLSGSGKTTIAHHVGPEMDRADSVVEYLDGDTVRTHLSKGSASRRRTRRRTSSASAGSLADHAPRGRSSWRRSRRTSRRANARALVEEHGPFIERHVRTSLEVRPARRERLYAKARSRARSGFTGSDDLRGARTPRSWSTPRGSRRRVRGGHRRSSRSSASTPAR